MRWRIPFFLLIVWMIVPATSSPAKEIAIPEPLKPWVDWVLEAHEDLACPLAGDLRICAWPGRLRLELDDEGGRFLLDLYADAETTVRLPGGSGQWPLEIRDGESSVRLRRIGDRPVASVAQGRRRLQGSFRWSQLPESLPVPPEVALISLELRGQEIPSPKRDDGGLLWLAPGLDKSAVGDRLTIEVNRRIADGVPLVIETWLRLRVSGSSREISLTSPLPEGFEAMALSSGLPSRLDPEGGLRVQLRPGEWEVRVAGRSIGPVTTLEVPDGAEPWPAEETWVFSAAPEVRSVRLEGLPGVDPKSTSLPDEWRHLPAFRAKKGASLEMIELRRGAADPGPDELAVERVIWLAQDGDSWTFRDRISGRLKQGGRLDLLEPGQLGRVSSAGQDRLITLGSDARSGVEIRSEQIDLTAELTYGRDGPLPAVGWNRDAGELSATLRLPPGWRLLATLGVDRAQGAWLSSWTLLDLFFLLLISLGCWRLFDLRTGLLALVILGISWHESSVPSLAWLFLLGTIALMRILPEGRLARVVASTRWMILAVLAIQWVVFAWQETRTGIFPQLGQSSSYTAPGFRALPAATQVDSVAEHMMELDRVVAAEEEMEGKVVASPMPQPRRAKKLSYGSFLRQSKQRDLDAVVQTGPGLPEWSWQSHSLTWRGPVAESEQMRFILISPGLERALAIVRVLGLGLLGVWLFGWRRESGPELRLPVALSMLCFLLLPGGALRAEGPLSPVPSPSLLQDLESRLIAPPKCHPNCVEVGQMLLRAGESDITFSVEVHASAKTFWRLPGPESVWRPGEVRIDGQMAAMRRLQDGFLAVRLGEGTHRIEATGRARDGMTLRFPLTPRFLDWQGEGWILEGYSEDGVPPGSVRLSRRRPLESGDDDPMELPPWVQVRRQLDLGIPWLVHNELRRLGPTGSAVLLKVPLIPGENVTSAGVEVQEGLAIVRLGAGESLQRWDSTLEEVETILLEAPRTGEWTEIWELACSPIFSCRSDGLDASRQMSGGVWIPEWRPWPGESLSIEVTRPEVAEGIATTVHGIRLTLEPGRRLRESMLEIDLRTSQGGEQSVVLPEGAHLQSFEVDGQPLSVRQEDRRWIYNLSPGEHHVKLDWRDEGGASFVERSPEIALDRGAVNVSVTMSVPENRWLLWAGGPSWGPVVSLWQYVLVLFLVAGALARFAPTPLRYLDWLLLGAGMTQVPLGAPVIVVCWLLTLGFRDRVQARYWWSHNLFQVALAGFSFVAVGCLWAAVQQGLLVQPDMQVIGGNSFGSNLVWYVDRIDGALPRPWVLWLPLWCWRVAMLLWALWLASRLLKWIPWGWGRFGIEGLWRHRSISEGPRIP